MTFMRSSHGHLINIVAVGPEGPYDSLTTCEECGGSLRKVYSPVGIVFKGSGFYRTDSRNGSGSGEAKDKPDAKDKQANGSGDGSSSKSADSGSSSSTRTASRARAA